MANSQQHLAPSSPAAAAEARITELRAQVAANPRDALAWRELAACLAIAGDEEGSRTALGRHVLALGSAPELADALDRMQRNDLAGAERLVRDVLRADPGDVNAMRMLAELGLKLGQADDAIHLLERCLELAPAFALARHNYAVALSRRQRFHEALAQADRLLADAPDDPNYQLLRGSLLVQKGDHAEALALYEAFVARYPGQSGAMLNYGHTLKTVGRLDDAVAAYRAAVRPDRTAGEAYWSLANLKTFRFGDDEIADMQARLGPEGAADADPDDQAHLLFALGKAFEDRARHDEAFGYYARGNAVRGSRQKYSARINVYDTARQIKTLDGGFFAEREGWGSPAPDPIFIVGLPRAGSTLLEQILASHSGVEGTTELPDIIAMARRLGKKSRAKPASLYPEVLASLTETDAARLGKNYLDSTRIHRHGTPYFIDKMPNNFKHIGLIHLILPNAKIIDARRHPMAGCFSCFKQLFTHGQRFTYSLEDLGHYYRDYVRLMDHWDAVLPGRVLQVRYEDMVADTEAQIRRLLDYCGLPFEDACLRFYETERAVRTPSSEQVRQPVYREGLEHWRNFEHHLAPLRQALGPLLDRYPVRQGGAD